MVYSLFMSLFLTALFTVQGICSRLPLMLATRHQTQLCAVVVASLVAIAAAGGLDADMARLLLAVLSASGVAANCIMSGACSGSTGEQQIATIVNATVERYAFTFSPYGFTGDAVSSLETSARYYGPMVWAKY